MLHNYSGYLKPYVSTIERLANKGRSVGAIARVIYQIGARSGVHPLSGTPQYVTMIELQRLRSTVFYILDRPAKPVKAPAKFLKPQRTRPIDMGGRRDEWHVWTPEMQAREFGL